jgi:hypothetical protein
MKETRYVVQYKSNKYRAWIDASNGSHSCAEAAKKDVAYRKKSHDCEYRIIQRNLTVEEMVLEQS